MLYIQEHHIELGGIIIPGQVKSVEVSGDANIDEVQDDKNTTLGYQATGYQPHKINVEVVLEPNSDMNFDDMVLQIHTLFKPVGQTEAKVLSVVNSQAASHNITQVFFKKIYTKKDTSKSYGTASLEFWEYIPLQVATTAAPTAPTATLPPAKTESAAAVSPEYQQYLNTQRGAAPKIADKTSSTPAVDE